MEEGHGRLQDQNVVVIGRAAHESASALDMVADLEAEALGEEGSGRLEIGRAEYGVAQLAWSDWGRSQYTGRAATRAHGTTGTVVRRGRDGLLRRSRGNLQIRDSPGGPIRGPDPAGPVLHVQSEAPQAAGGAGQVVQVVHTDVQVDQPAGRCGHDAQLAAAVARGEPAVFEMMSVSQNIGFGWLGKFGRGIFLAPLSNARHCPRVGGPPLDPARER